MGIGQISVQTILALVALEALALFAYRLATGRGPSPLPMLFTLLAGGFLLLALRSALNGGAPSSVALFALGAFIAHGADLASRWAGAPPMQASHMRATIALRVPDRRKPRENEAFHG